MVVNTCSSHKRSVEELVTEIWYFCPAGLRHLWFIIVANRPKNHDPWKGGSCFFRANLLCNMTRLSIKFIGTLLDDMPEKAVFLICVYKCLNTDFHVFLLEISSKWSNKQLRNVLGYSLFFVVDVLLFFCETTAKRSQKFSSHPLWNVRNLFF